MDGNQALIDAVKAGDLASVKVMLESDPSLVDARTPEGISAVLMAIYYNEPAIAAYLIEQHASLDIFEAAAAGQTERVQELLDKDPSLANAYSPDGFQPLGLAAFFGHLPAAELLIEVGADPGTPSKNNQRVQPLNSAAAGGHLEIARLLLEHGADPNARQAGEFVPLHNAAQNGQIEMIELLLSYGADKSARNSHELTPLDFAVEEEHDEAAELLK